MLFRDKSDLATRLNVQARYLPELPDLVNEDARPKITARELANVCAKFGFNYNLVKKIVEEPTE